jgi:hypothetical protein
MARTPKSPPPRRRSATASAVPRWRSPTEREIEVRIHVPAGVPVGGPLNCLTMW